MAAETENAICSGDHQFSRQRTPPPSPPPSSDCKSEFQHDVKQLVDLLSKLNPSAKEFIPSSKSPSPPVDANDPGNDGSGIQRRVISSFILFYLFSVYSYFR